MNAKTVHVLVVEDNDVDIQAIKRGFQKEKSPDMVASYSLNVAGYMVKDQVGENFIDLVQMLDHYRRVV